jgi:hypothetical protein
MDFFSEPLKRNVASDHPSIKYIALEGEKGEMSVDA